MKNLKLLLLMLSFPFFAPDFFSGQVFAQQSNYDLKQYILGDYDFNALSVNFGSNGNNTNGSNENDETSNFYRIGGNGAVFYSKFLNTRKQQISISSNLSFGGSREDETNYEKPLYRNDLRLGINYSHRLYDPKNRFVGLGIGANYDYRKSQSSANITNTTVFFISSRHNALISPQLSFGFGRIEDVRDSWQAIRIVEFLKEVDAIDKDPTEQQIIELARLISVRRNWRFYDFRLKRIEDIKLLDELLQQQGIVSNPDAAYFTTLTDIWGFGVNGRRTTGTSLSFGINTPYYYEQFENELNFIREGEFNTLGLIAFGEYASNNPYRLNAQFDYSFRLEGGRISGDYYSTDGPNYFISPSASTNWGYFPTTRTEFNLRATTRYFAYDGDSRLNQDQIQAGINGSFYYYFSPQTRLEVGLNYVGKLTPTESNQISGLSQFCGNSYLFFPNVPINAGSPNCSGISYSINFTHAFF